MVENKEEGAVIEERSARHSGRFRRSPGWLRGLLIIPVLMIAALVGGLFWLDTDSGHDFIERQVAALEPQNGLRISIGNIEGSIYSTAIIQDLQLSDPDGVFFSSPEVTLDWFIFAFITNRLSIDELSVPKATLARLPEFIPSEEEGDILPSFDIVIDQLSIGALAIDESITGRPITVGLSGNADIRGGRAIIDLTGLSTAGDRIVLTIDAVPDGDDFDIAADIVAPDDGILPALAGFDSGFTLQIDGDGTWENWTGNLAATYDGNPAADLDLALADGRWRVAGRIERPGFLQGIPERVIGDAAQIDLAGTWADQILTITGAVETSSLATDIDGAVNFADNEIDDLQIMFRRLEIAAILPDARSTGLNGQIWLDGAFDALDIDYAFSAREFFIGDTGFQNLMAQGDSATFGDIVRVPVNVTATQVVGTGELAEQALSNLRVAGALILDGSELTSENLVLTTDQIDSRILVGANLESGQYDVALQGNIRDFNIQNFGQVDLVADIRIRPDAGGFLSLAGRIQADMDRLDIGFLQTIAGGLPRLDTDISLGRDNRFRFSDFTLRSPKFVFRGDGVRNSDGLFDISGTGVHSDYGNLDMTLTGVIDRPKVVLHLDAPLPAAGLANVNVLLDPNPDGFSIVSDGESLLGPFDLDGQLLLPANADGALRIDALTVAGSTGQGLINFGDAGPTGRLDIAGGSINGNVVLGTEGSAQLITADLAIRGLNSTSGAGLSIAQGQVSAVARLDGDSSDIQANVDAQGVRTSGFAFGKVTLEADIRNGAGQVALNLGGMRGSSFEFEALATIDPQFIEVVGDGSFRNRPIVISRSIRLERNGDVWELLPSELRYGGGTFLAGGRMGDGETLAAVEMENFPLSFFDLGDSQLGLSGRASGVASYADVGGAPVAELGLQLRDFSRSGLYLSSTPIDIAVNAKLDPREFGMRAVLRDDAVELGRMQAMIQNVPASGDGLYNRLASGNLSAELRYGGPAAALWRLAGVELFDLTGTVYAGADVSGTLSAPQIRGSVASDNARLESAATGTVINNIRMRGDFDGSRLTITEMRGTTARDGRIQGNGSILLSGAAGPVIDLAFRANNALLLNRDDFSAQVTGPLTVRSDETGGGTLAGDFRLERATFDLGNASTAEALPNVNVIEVNGRADAPVRRVVTTPWTLDVSANADNRVFVSGLGLESEWRADLDISGPVDSFRLLGEANLVRGEFEFAGKTFELTRGEIGFPGGEEINPTLDIAANADVEGINATVTVTGRGQSPQIGFTSSPAMPQEELLSRILFGTSITDLSAAEALQLGVAVASLQGGGGGLDPINAVRQAAGLDRLRIIGDEENEGVGTAVAAGKYLNSDTYVELITDGQGYSATQVEYRITRWLSVLSSISTLGRQQVSARVSKDY